MYDFNTIKISKALELEDIVNITNTYAGDITDWTKFTVGNTVIHVGHEYHNKHETFFMNIYGSDNLINSIIEKSDNTNHPFVLYPKDNNASADLVCDCVNDLSGLYETFAFIGKQIFAQPMVLESGLSDWRGELLANKKFLVRKTKESELVIIDLNYKPLLIGTSIKEVKKFNNGYWYLKTQNTKYQFVMA